MIVLWVFGYGYWVYRGVLNVFNTFEFHGAFWVVGLIGYFFRENILTRSLLLNCFQFLLKLRINLDPQVRLKALGSTDAFMHCNRTPITIKASLT